MWRRSRTPLPDRKTRKGWRRGKWIRGLGSNGGKGRFVEAAGVDGAVSGEAVDDELDGFDLVAGVAPVVEEGGDVKTTPD